VLGVDEAAPGDFVDVDRHPNAHPVPGVLIVRPDAPLFYANAQAVEDGVRTLLASNSAGTHTVLIDLDANDELDITSIEALTKLATTREQAHVRLGLVHLPGPARSIAQCGGLLDHLLADRIHPNSPPRRPGLGRGDRI
jgi:SulP family sulfate permease